MSEINKSISDNGATAAVVVVTYNRCNDLLKCLESLTTQSRLPQEIIIVNNQSPDDTEQRLTEAGYIPDIKDAEPTLTESGKEYTRTYHASDGGEIRITYLLKADNDGGAGGFYAGMKSSFVKGHDWTVLMDDDGCPDKDTLKELIHSASRHDLKYANALVIDRDDHNLLAFSPSTSPTKVADFAGIELIPDYGSPFNATLIHRSLIEEIGFIKKEMFIWGDEFEYTMRAKAHGHPITTICAARHYHPKTGQGQNMIPFIKKWKILPPSKKRASIYYRNQCYVMTEYGLKAKLWKFVIRNLVGTILNFQWKYIPGMIKSMRRGCRKDFSN